MKFSEEKNLGATAFRFYNLLKKPLIDQKRKKLIKETLRRFPHPNTPIEINMDL